MRGRIVAVAVSALVVSATTARADWSYTWWCTGQCAPGELGVQHTVGGFATEDSCEAARAGDPHNALATQSGSLANVDGCVGSDGAGDDTSGGRPVHAGIGRIYGGLAVGVISDRQLLGASGGFGGIELARGGWPGHHLYFMLDLSGSSLDVRKPDGTTSNVGEVNLIAGVEYQIGDGRTIGLVQLGGGLVLGDSDGAFGVRGGFGVSHALTDRTSVLLLAVGVASTTLPAPMFLTIGLEHRSAQLVDLRDGS